MNLYELTGRESGCDNGTCYNWANGYGLGIEVLSSRRIATPYEQIEAMQAHAKDNGDMPTPKKSNGKNNYISWEIKLRYANENRNTIVTVCHGWN